MILKLIGGLVAAVIIASLIGCAAHQALVVTDARSQYDAARALYDRGRYDEAVMEFQKVMFNYPGLSYIDSVQYWLGMSYYGRDDQHLAIAEFRHLMSNFPSSKLTDDAQFMIGKSFFEAAPNHVGLDQSDNESAIKELTAFLEDCPSSDRRKEGELLLSNAIGKMAEKQFRSGKQYYRMGNRVSARLYLEDVIKEYPESREIPEALFLLAKIDEKEHKYADARDKLNNLIKVFPKSEYSGKAADMKQELEIKIGAGAQTNNDSVKVTKEKSER